jgi:hypothetical protein
VRKKNSEECKDKEGRKEEESVKSVNVKVE